MKVLKLLALSLLCVVSTTNVLAQGTEHTFSVSYGPGLITSKMYNYSNREEYSSRGGKEVQGEYTCTFMKNDYWGLGFGFLGSYNTTSYPDFTVKQLYLAPEFNVSIKTRNQKWRMKGCLGIGGGSMETEYDEKKWGVALNASLGCEYLITPHFGLGVDLDEFASFFGTSDSDKYSLDGCARYAIVFGARIHL